MKYLVQRMIMNNTAWRDISSLDSKGLIKNTEKDYILSCAFEIRNTTNVLRIKKSNNFLQISYIRNIRNISSRVKEMSRRKKLLEEKSSVLTRGSNVWHFGRGNVQKWPIWKYRWLTSSEICDDTHCSARIGPEETEDNKPRESIPAASIRVRKYCQAVTRDEIKFRFRGSWITLAARLGTRQLIQLDTWYNSN